MNKNIAIAIIILAVVVGGIFLLSSRQNPSETTPPPQGGTPAEGQPIPNVTPLNLPPPNEDTIQITGTVKRVSGSQLTVEVQKAPPVPQPTPDQFIITSYQVTTNNETVIRLITTSGPNIGEKPLKLSDLEIGTSVTVVGIKKSETSIEAQAIQTFISQ